jgi:hypothetical protein
LVGDHRLRAEIEAGGAFAALASRLGAIELTENRRQRELWEREALDQLRSGSVADGLTAYDSHERIHVAPSMAEARQATVESWLQARDAGSEVLMLAVGRRDVDALNVLARASLQDRGVVGADVTAVGDRSFAVGDEVVCLRNNRRLGVLNGTRGTIVDINRAAFTVATPDGERSLPRRYVEAGHLDYGYASTIHKAQGATYEHAFVLATDALTREAGYVAMSRARAGTELFVADGAFEHGHGPDYLVDEPLARTAARLATSRSKQLASSYLRGDNKGLPFNSVSDLNGGSREVGHVVHPRFETTNTGRTGPSLQTDFSESDQPGYITDALGSRPAFVDEQADYDALADAIERYRTRNQVIGNDALGVRPFSVIPRIEFDAVRAQIDAYGRFRWRELDPPDLGLGLGR